MDIDLLVNNCHIQLQKKLDVKELMTADFKKVGLLMSLILKFRAGKLQQSGDIIYWSKNPTIRCFEDKNGWSDEKSVYILPPKETNDQDMKYATSVFLHFNEGKLRLAIVQIMNSYFLSQLVTSNFREHATKRFGDAEQTTQVKVRYSKEFPVFEDKFLFNKWCNGSETLTSQLAQSGNSAFVLWES